MLLWVLSVVLADAPEPRLQDADYEVVVVAEQSAREAMEAVAQTVKSLGYVKTVKIGSRSHHLNAKPWNGGVMIDDAGFARIHAPLFFPIGLASDATSVSATFLWVGPRVRKQRKARIAAALEPDLRAYRDAIAAREQAWRLLELHETLHRAWELGLAPDGSAIGDDPAVRRAWLVARWENTADNADGAEIRARIADFVVHRVQLSDHPFPDDQLARFVGAASGPDD